MKVTISLQHTLTEKESKSFKTRLFTVITKWWTSSPYFHSELIVKDKYYSISPSEKGVFEKPLESLRPEYRYIDVEVDGRKYSRFLKKFAETKGRKYDWFGIFLAQGFGLTVDDKNKYFCSEIVTDFLKAFDVEEVKDVNSVLVSPGDLHTLFIKG